MNQELLQLAAKNYGTPSYLFDLDLLTERLTMIRATLGEDITLCYAMKANPFLINAMDGLVERFEVCSPGEFRICERADISMERIVLSGVHKEAREITRVVDTYDGQGIFTVESLEHLNILNSCALESKKTLLILLRVTSGNQFGMDEETIYNIIANREQYPFLTIQGLQFYSGTQKKQLSKIEQELHNLDTFCSRLETDCGFVVPELEYGPGFYVPYFQNEEDSNDVQLLNDFRELLHKMNYKGHITLEMGRFMTAYCGYFMTSIVDSKTNNNQSYCIIDGGIHHLNYYGQTMAMKLPHFTKFPLPQDGDVQNYTICGSLCTVGDVLVKQLPLKGMQVHDILVFERLGAYSVTEGIFLFLSRDLPKILFYSSSEGFQLVRDAMPTDTINTSN